MIPTKAHRPRLRQRPSSTSRCRSPYQARRRWLTRSKVSSWHLRAWPGPNSLVSSPSVFPRSFELPQARLPLQRRSIPLFLTKLKKLLLTIVANGGERRADDLAPLAPMPAPGR